MMVFGKKCPACGGKRLAARSPVSRLAALPFTRSYTCSDCQQQVVALFPFSIGVEHRQFVRKRLPSFFLARLPGNTNRYVQIKNISEGGICLHQHAAAVPVAGGFFRLDLYNCNDGSSLEHLRAEIVATFNQTLEINGIKTTIRKHCARFVNLNQAQKKVLLTCLAQHGT